MASAAPTFAYKAVDGAGLPQEGTIIGASQAAVLEELKNRGLQVMRLDENKNGMKMELRLMPKRVKASELTVMTRQLATMVSSGMTLLRAFYVLEDQVENPKLKDTLSAVREDIESGLNFSDALEKHPKVFGPLYVAMVRAGEAGGVLEQALDRTADQLEKDDSLRRQVKGAMTYPAVVLTFALGTLLALIAFIVPVFVGIFKDFGGKLPLITQFTVNLSNLVTGQWYILLAVTVGSVVAFRKWKKSSWGRPQWDALRLKIPVNIGKTVQKIALARWSRTFSALYSAGVPIMQAIEVTGKTAGNTVVERAMDDVIASVKAGGSIAAPLKDTPIFPGMVSQMIAVGEETGNLDTMLTKVADFYEDEVAAAIKAMTSILEPVMIVLVGGIVGFIVVAMYMPMFKVYDAIPTQ
jgi:type IV pilus assembly protein PilC